MNILLVDDQVHIREMIEIYLKNEGYEVDHANNGLEGYEMLKKQHYDFLILDLMMPVMTGEELVMKLRGEGNTIPIIILSAKGQDMDRITCLTLGADDYIVKPFNPLEVIARMKAMVRRGQYLQTQQKQSIGNILTYQGLEINKDARTIVFESNPLHATPTEFDILVLLLENQGLVLSGEQIYQRIWKDDYIPSLNTVMVHIRNIRDKVEKATGQKIIQTVWGVGYKIEKV